MTTKKHAAKPAAKEKPVEKAMAAAAPLPADAQPLKWFIQLESPEGGWEDDPSMGGFDTEKEAEKYAGIHFPGRKFVTLERLVERRASSAS